MESPGDSFLCLMELRRLRCPLFAGWIPRPGTSFSACWTSVGGEGGGSGCTVLTLWGVELTGRAQLAVLSWLCSSLTTRLLSGGFLGPSSLGPSSGPLPPGRCQPSQQLEIQRRRESTCGFLHRAPWREQYWQRPRARDLRKVQFSAL